MCYIVRKGCLSSPGWPYCLIPDAVNIDPFLNQDWVKEALGFPASFHFQYINQDMHLTFRNYGSPWNPTTKELIEVLDAYSEKPKVADIKVLVMNGNLDYVVNTQGNMWQYDRLEWSGMAEYAAKDWLVLKEDVAAKGFWKATSDGRLAFIGLDDAGHTVASDVREGSYSIVNKWLERKWRM